MRFIICKLFVIIVICSLSIIESSKIKRNGNKRWFFDSIFGWNKGDVEIINTLNKSEKMNFKGEINYSNNGVYFSNIEGNPDLSYYSYQSKEDQKIATVIDFQVIVDCEVTKNENYGLTFKLRKIHTSQDDKNLYTLNIKYGTASNFFGSFDTKKTLEKIVENCKARQEEIRKLILAAEQTKKRLEQEAEILKNKLKEEFKDFIKDTVEGVKDLKKPLEEQWNSANRFFNNLIDSLNKKVEESKKQGIEKAVKEVKITENPKETKTLEKEKKIIAEMNFIEVYYESKFGFGLFITGEEQYLGKWEKMFRLIPFETKDGKTRWQFKSELIKENDVFKIILYNYDAGEVVDISHMKEQDNLKISPDKANPKQISIIYEKPAGAQGNKKMKFIQNKMSHAPKFVQ